MYEGGVSSSDKPAVAVNLGATSVTAPGFEALIDPIVDPIQALIGGEDAKYASYQSAYYVSNPGLAFTDIQYKGFTAAVVTPKTHTASWFGIPDRLLNYTSARALNNGSLTARYLCLASCVTQSSTPGSLNCTAKSGCQDITFAKTRSALLNLPVPITPLSSTVDATNCGTEGCTFLFAGGAASTSAPATAPTKTSSAPSFFATFTIMMGSVIGLLRLFLSSE